MSTYDGHVVKRQRLNDNSASAQGDYEGGRDRTRPEAEPNKILLLTILNPVYPITTEILHTICEPCGEVQRIVIFRKRGVQAMVEFNSIQSAQRAKASLNGADIYSGCCTLKIEWAKATRLNVYKNDDETMDYTTPAEKSGAPTQVPLLGDAPLGYANGAGRFPRPGGRSGLGQRPMGMPPRPRMARGGMQVRPRHASAGMMGMQQPMSHDYGGMDDYGMQDMGTAYSQSPVVMLYGLCPEKMNCQRVFNMLCLYGNVMKVKFLKSKPGTAMVQMGDPLAVDRAIAGLSGMRFFDDKLVLAPSKQLYLTDSGAPSGELPDGTPTQEDYTNSRNNRFITTEQAAKNRIQNPSKVLHYYNAPIDLDEEKMKEICEENKVEPPSKFVPFKGKSDRSSSGLMEFDTKTQALECLTTVNHYQIDNPDGRYPFNVKLCFSTASTANVRDRD